MAMVGVVSGSLYRRTHSLSRLAWSWVGGRLAPFYIHQMNRVNSCKWLCYDDSTINIVFELLLLLLFVDVPKYERPAVMWSSPTRDIAIQGQRKTMKCIFTG